jgi:hypothetical protein
MKINLFLAILFLGMPARADSNSSVIKSWKTYKSDLGFAFKYPDCWELLNEDSNLDSKTVPIQSADIFSLVEKKNCARPRFVPSSINGIGFMKGEDIEAKPKEDEAKSTRITDYNGNAAVKGGKYFYYKRGKIGSGDGIMWVESFTGVKGSKDSTIRWQFDVACPKRHILITGPAILNPENSYYEKFKLGDLALPEPEKTIIESFRCTSAKEK